MNVSPRKGGALNPNPVGLSRHAVALVAVCTLLGLPLVLLGGAAAHAAGSGRPSVASTMHRVDRTGPSLAGRALRHVQLTDNRLTMTAVAAPTTTSTPTTVVTPAPRPATIATTPVARAAQVVAHPAPALAPVPTTTPPTASNRATGLATWYAWNAGQCASPVLPKGTWVTVTNNATGARTSCEVTDREADNPGRVIDLDTSVFAQIAPLSSGAVPVTISW